MGRLHVKFHEDRCKGEAVMRLKPFYLTAQSLYGDLDLWPFDPKFHRAHTRLMGRLHVKFHEDRCKGEAVMRLKPFYLTAQSLHCDLDLWPFDPKFHRAHTRLMGRLHVKFHEDRCKGEAVMRLKPFYLTAQSLYGDLDLWPFDPKFHRAHTRLMGRLHVKFHEDRCKGEAVMRLKPFYPTAQSLYGDLDLWPFDPKFHRAHTRLMGRLHVKFHEDRCKGEAVMRLKPFYLTAQSLHCDLDLWPFDPKFHRAHTRLMGRLHVKFHEDRCKGEAVMRLKPFYLTAQSLYGDLDLWPFDPKFHRAHTRLMGRLHVKFHEDRCKGEAVMRLKPFYLTAQSLYGDLDLWPFWPQIS